MREYKFRGKQVDNGEWVYGYLWVCKTATIETAYITDEKGGMFQVIPESVGQYTGLRDKNGKEIYEGDITTHHRFNTIEKWVYHERFLQYLAIESDGTHRYYFDRDKEDLEVISNVHDNPELWGV